MEKQHDATTAELLEMISSLRADAKTELLDTKVVLNPTSQPPNPEL